MKGLYPGIVYVLLLAVGIIIFALAYSFTLNFMDEKKAELEELRLEKICNFLRSLKGKNLEVEIDLGNYRIESNPLRIIGSSIKYCELNLTTHGSCSDLCRIKSSERGILFS